MSADERGQARERIRAGRSGRRLAVLDDDPTGSQSVHNLQIVTVVDHDEITQALELPGSTAFVLTNTRGLPEAQAVALTMSVVTSILTLDPSADIVSRSDSTLRGHVLAEVTAIADTRVRITGVDYDGILLAPAFFEAGRVTEGDVHYATVGGVPVPVGATEFSRDATFGYSSSDLRDFVAEKSRGTISRDDVLSISLSTIRTGGVDAVRDILLGAQARTFIVVNATEYADFETVVLGVQAAIELGKSFLYRCGPSFVRALAGLEPRAPLEAKDFPELASVSTYGLVVVGSHVSQTSRQLDAARRIGGLIEFELDVARVLGRDDGYVDETISGVRAALARADVLIYTSRALVVGEGADMSLGISLEVSAAVSRVVAGALAAHPAWVVAKGGITSHDVAVRGLGMRRAEVLGQLLQGMVSVFDPISASPAAVGMPYVVFAGNVGDDGTLAYVIGVLRAAQGRRELAG